MSKVTSSLVFVTALAVAGVQAEDRGQGMPERAVRVGIKFSGSQTSPSLSVGVTRRSEEVVVHRYGAPFFEPLYFELIGKLDGQQDAGLLYAGRINDPRASFIERSVKGEPAEKPIEWADEGTVDIVLPDVPGAILRIWKRTPADPQNPRQKLLEHTL